MELIMNSENNQEEWSGEWCDTDINDLLLRRRFFACHCYTLIALWYLKHKYISYEIRLRDMGDDFKKPLRTIKWSRNRARISKTVIISNHDMGKNLTFQWYMCRFYFELSKHLERIFVCFRMSFLLLYCILRYHLNVVSKMWKRWIY